MSKAAQRALDAKKYLEAKGYDIELFNPSGSDYIMGFLAEENDTVFPVMIMFTGNAFVIRVEIESYDIDDFDNMAQARKSIPEFHDYWAGAAYPINSKMDGLCYICAEKDDDPSLSVNGVTRGYHLDDAGATEYFYEKLCQALTQTEAGSAVAKIALQQNFA